MRRAFLVAAALTSSFVMARLAVAAGQSPGTEAATPDRGQLTIVVGAGLGAGRLREGGRVGAPPIFAGLELQVRVRRALGIGFIAGGNVVTGGLLGANARLESHAADRLFVSAGAGPLIVPSGSLAGAVLVQGDLTFSWRFKTNAALMIGPTLAVAVREGGQDHCYVDTCDRWVGVGARILMLRIGFGAAF